MNERENWTFKAAYDLGEANDRSLSPELFSEIAGAGFKGVHLSLADSGPITLASPEADLRRIADDVSAAGLAAAALFCPRNGLTDIAAAEPSRRDIAVQTVIALLDRAAWLGAETLVISPTSPSSRGETNASYADTIALALGSLLALRFEAEIRGVVLSCRGISNGFLQSPLEARRFIDRVSLPFVGISIDSGSRASCPVDQYVNILTHRITHARIGVNALATNSAADPVAMGKDKELVAALSAVGYDASLTVTAGPDPGNAMRYLRSVMPASDNCD